MNCTPQPPEVPQQLQQSQPLRRKLPLRYARMEIDMDANKDKERIPFDEYTPRPIRSVREHVMNLYAPYCKVQIPGSKKADGTPHFQKVYLDRIRKKENPSLQVLHNVVAQNLVQYQQQQYQKGLGGTAVTTTHQIPPFCLRYQDDDGDMVDLTCDRDLQDALKHPPTEGLKLLVCNAPSRNHRHSSFKRKQQREQKKPPQHSPKLPYHFPQHCHEPPRDIQIDNPNSQTGFHNRQRAHIITEGVVRSGDSGFSSEEDGVNSQNLLNAYPSLHSTIDSAEIPYSESLVAVRSFQKGDTQYVQSTSYHRQSSGGVEGVTQQHQQQQRQKVQSTTNRHPHKLLNCSGGDGMDHRQENVTHAITREQKSHSRPQIHQHRQHRQHPPVIQTVQGQPVSPLATTRANEMTNPAVPDQNEICQIELSLYRRPNAVVRIGLNVILDNESCASYWQLVQFATHAFRIPVGAQIALFRENKKAKQPLQEVTNDMDLSEQLAILAGTNTRTLYIQVVDSSVLIGKPDGSLLEVPLSTIMNKNGSCSFFKLLNNARMANPTKPVQSLAYLSSEGKRTIHSDACMQGSFVEDLSRMTSHQPSIVLHPVYQSNPFMLRIWKAQLQGECTLADSPPRIRLYNSSAVVYWDVTGLAPGRYRATTRYYRGVKSGSVRISAGVVKSLPPAFTQNNADVCRSMLPPTVFLPATGQNPMDSSSFGLAELGEFEILGHSSVQEDQDEDDTITAPKEWFMVVADEGDTPLMSIQDLELRFLGISAPPGSGPEKLKTVPAVVRPTVSQAMQLLCHAMVPGACHFSK